MTTTERQWNELLVDLQNKHRTRPDALTEIMTKPHQFELFNLEACFWLIQGSHCIKKAAHEDLKTTPIIPVNHMDTFMAYQQTGMDVSATSSPENHFTFPGLKNKHNWLNANPVFEQ